MKHTLKYHNRLDLDVDDMILINISVIQRIRKAREILRLVNLDSLKEDYISELTALRHLKKRSL